MNFCGDEFRLDSLTRVGGEVNTQGEDGAAAVVSSLGLSRCVLIGSDRASQ